MLISLAGRDDADDLFRSEESISDSGLVASRSSTCCCRFVSGLLKIDSAFMLISLAGRDDADDLFAIFRLPVNMHDNQEKPASDHSQGVPSLFPSSSILSSISTMFGSSNTRAAVLKPNPCFLWLVRSFVASHSNLRMFVIHIV